MRARAAVLTAALVVAGGLATSTQAAAPTAGYVVTVRDTVSPERVERLAEALGGTVGFTYRDALRGFSVRLPVPALPALQALPGVAKVYPDQVVRVAASQPNPPSYGLDRVDQRSLPLNGSYRYRADGRGVTAYVLDTGIARGHPEFAGRLLPGFDAVTSGGSAQDCHGHGTHVAGTIGGTTYGVAKKVRLLPVRVLGCDGSAATSVLVAGLDFVARHHQAGRPAVANISIEAGADEAIDAAVNRVLADGVTVVAAAANGGSLVTDLLGWDDACDYSPARVPGAITVAATDRDDARAPFSNRGPCVDVWAPGADIISAGRSGGSETMSGTSMAAPHVAGAAALILQRAPSARPGDVAAAINRAATRGVVQNAGRSPNLMLLQAW